MLKVRMGSGGEEIWVEECRGLGIEKGGNEKCFFCRRK